MILKTSSTKNTTAKILILGAGYIGKSVKLTLQEQNPNYDITILAAADVDYHNSKLLWNHMVRHSYNLVINCSGFTGRPNVDQGEELKEDCWEYNVVSPVNCANICTKLVYGISKFRAGVSMMDTTRCIPRKTLQTLDCLGNLASIVRASTHLNRSLR